MVGTSATRDAYIPYRMATTPPGKLRVRKSRIVHLDGGQQRPHGHNRCTMLAPPMPGPDPAPFGSPQNLFVRHFERIRTFVEGRAAHVSAGRVESDPGVALIAIDRVHNTLVGRLWVAAKMDGVGVGIVGRHGAVDLFLDADPALSNRHVALCVEPIRGWTSEDVRFRLVDLRTGLAMQTPAGEHVESLVAEGPVFVTLGRYQLMAFPTGGVQWPSDANDAWWTLPQQTVIDERRAEPDQWQRFAQRGRASGRGNLTLLPAPEPLGGAPLGPPMGTLKIRSQVGAIERTIGQSEAARGIVLGREPRCDFAGLLRLMQVSRVHLLIKRMGGVLYAFDAGSTAGVFELVVGQGPAGRPQARMERTRCVRLDRATRLTLGHGLVDLQWVPLLLH